MMIPRSLTAGRGRQDMPIPTIVPSYVPVSVKINSPGQAGATEPQREIALMLLSAPRQCNSRFPATQLIKGSPQLR